MNERETPRENEEIFSKALRAGRRTYFFDVRATKADDYYLTITESKKYTNEDGSFRYKKHKIYLYKEDFEGFKEFLNESTDYIFQNRGEEVISDRHQQDFVAVQNEEEVKKVEEVEEVEEVVSANSNESFTDVDFEDL
ncbi:MAG: PUR family DNA/RNA-binding protein [Bacteroidota bacterium]